jgi:hypothetical protein
LRENQIFAKYGNFQCFSFEILYTLFIFPLTQNSNGVSGMLIENWSKTFSCKPELYFEPKSVDEIKEILNLAKINKKKIKIIGAGHSPSSIALSNDYLISLKHLRNVLSV